MPALLLQGFNAIRVPLSMNVALDLNLPQGPGNNDPSLAGLTSVSPSTSADEVASCQLHGSLLHDDCYGLWRAHRIDVIHLWSASTSSTDIQFTSCAEQWLSVLSLPFTACAHWLMMAGSSSRSAD